MISVRWNSDEDECFKRSFPGCIKDSNYIDWEYVSNMVGTRSMEQCKTHFKSKSVQRAYDPASGSFPVEIGEDNTFNKELAKAYLKYDNISNGPMEALRNSGDKELEAVKDLAILYLRRVAEGGLERKEAVRIRQEDIRITPTLPGSPLYLDTPYPPEANIYSSTLVYYISHISHIFSLNHQILLRFLRSFKL